MVIVIEDVAENGLGPGLPLKDGLGGHVGPHEVAYGDDKRVLILQLSRGNLIEIGDDTLLHLGRRFLCEGDRQNGAEVLSVEQQRDVAGRQSKGLTGAG